MKHLILAAIFGAAVMIPSTAMAAPKAPKNYICHWQAEDMDGDGIVAPMEGKYKLLKLSASGAANHLKNHTANDERPADFTAVEDFDCNAAV